MKRILSVFALTSILVLGLSVAPSQAGIYVGFNVGGGYGGYHHEYHGYGGRYYSRGPEWCGRESVYYSAPIYYSSPVVYGPPVVYEQAPVVVQQPVQVVQENSGVAYGLIQTGGILKSPYSSFAMNIGGHSSGDVVYDANNGKPFRVP